VDCVVGLNRGQVGFECQSTARTAAGAAAADGVEVVSGVVAVTPFTHSAQVGSRQESADSAALVGGRIGAVGTVSWWFIRFKH